MEREILRGKERERNILIVEKREGERLRRKERE